MITKIWCGRSGQVGYNFSNGNSVSILWGYGSYSDNHFQFIDRQPGTDIKELWRRQEWESTRVEVMVFSPEDDESHAFEKWFIKRYGDNPGGYLDVNEIPAILKEADKEKYASTN